MLFLNRVSAVMLSFCVASGACASLAVAGSFSDQPSPETADYTALLELFERATPTPIRGEIPKCVNEFGIAIPNNFYSRIGVSTLSLGKLYADGFPCLSSPIPSSDPWEFAVAFIPRSLGGKPIQDKMDRFFSSCPTTGKHLNDGTLKMQTFMVCKVTITYRRYGKYILEKREVDQQCEWSKEMSQFLIYWQQES
jgi:hypothetical protein